MNYLFISFVSKTDLLRDIPIVDAAAGSVASPYKQQKPSATPQQPRAAGDPPVVSKVSRLRTRIDVY